MKKTLKEAILLFLIALILAFAFNFISPNSIALVGTWYDNRGKVRLEQPPSYDPNYDSLLTMQEAFTLWNDKAAVFIDTREPDEYAEGHIAGAINFPFEEWDDYWWEIEQDIDPSMTIVCYCNGLDCELSLFAAREFKELGYENTYIFFGGYNQWIEAKLTTESNYED